MGKRKLEQQLAAVTSTVTSNVHKDRAGQISVEENSSEAQKAGLSSDDDSSGSSDEEEDENAAAQAPKTHPGRLTKKQKRQLSAQEVQVARETAELFKSNIFKLQIDELIKEVKLKELHVTRIEQVLHRLHDCVLQVPSTEALLLAEAEALFDHKRVTIPFPDPKPTKTNYTFGYLPPEDVSLVGSFGLKSATSAGTTAIDIALTMPRALFQPKDYLNYRALYKRAFYVAYLADQLIPLTRHNHLPVKILYHFLNGDVLCPVLKLESIGTDNPEDLSFHKTKTTVNLIVSFPPGFFDAKKLLPDKNCVRIQAEGSELPPTPLYNSLVLSQSTYDQYLKYLYTSKKAAESFKDACILGRLWLLQRLLGGSVDQGGFGHFEFALLMLALLHGGGESGSKVLLHGFSLYQLFKGTVKYLATVDLCLGYLSFSSTIGESASKYSTEGFGVPTVFDKHVKLNVLWKMTKASYRTLQNCSRETLSLLNDVVRDRFDAILLQKCSVEPLRHDVVVKMDVPESVHEQFGPLEKITFISFENFLRHKLSVVLQTAIGERATQIHISPVKKTGSFTLSRRKPSLGLSFTIGIRLNPDESEKLVTKGPNNDDEEAGARFRAFWGPRASLRRFKDGTIQHCVVWGLENSEPVVVSIIRSAISTHISADSVLSTDIAAYHNLLPIPLVPAAASQGITSVQTFGSLKSAFDDFSKMVGALELPLGVKSVMPASSGLRNTALLQPVPFSTLSPDFWNDVVLQFETSLRWPDELSALERTKTALLLKVHEGFQDSAYRTYLQKDASITFNEHVTVLLVLTPLGYGFRVRVLTERDEVLYLRAVANADKLRAVVQDVYVQFNQRYVGVVKHTRSVGLLAHRFPFYSPTVRLFKRWLDSQLLLSHFSEELVELIALKPFVDPAPYGVPCSVENGFLHILVFLSSWNWREDPLILDLGKPETDDFKLSDRLSVQAYQVIESNFTKIRKTDPSGIKTQLFVASKDDPSGILWSNGLTLPIASRLTVLARAAVLLVKSEGAGQNTLEKLFIPALNDYDFVVEVQAASLTKLLGILVESTFKNLLGNETAFPSDMASKYDLIQAYVEELNRKFGNVILFSTRRFTGLSKDGSSVIGGIFVPAALQKKKFRVGLGVDVKPTENDDVVINKESIFSQIELLGGDLVQSVKVHQ